MSWQPGALVTLATERFELRSIAREDVTEEFCGWIADPAVMVGLNMPRQQLSRRQAVRWALGYDNQTKFFLTIRTRADDRAIGFFIVDTDPRHRTADTSVVLGDQAWWGRNVVVEARGALLDFLFDVVGVHKVTGRPHGRNISSIFNYQALGFRCEAVLREQMRSITDESRLDQLVFGLLREEWLARRRRGERQ